MMLDTETYAQRKARLDAQSVAELDAQNRARWLDRIRQQSDLGERFATRTFATWRGNTYSEAFDYAKAIAVNHGGAWFCGDVGTGKTHLAAAIVNDCLERGVPAIFTTGVRLLDRVRMAYHRDGTPRDSERDVIALYCKSQVLVLDDLGKERFTAWTAERLYDLINRRYESNLPIVVTSNLAPDRLADHWTAKDMDPTTGAALVRRLSEMANKVVRLEVCA